MDSVLAFSESRSVANHGFKDEKIPVMNARLCKIVLLVALAMPSLASAKIVFPMMLKWSAFGNPTNAPYWDSAEEAAQAYCASKGQPYVRTEITDGGSGANIYCHLDGYGPIKRLMRLSGFCPYGVIAEHSLWLHECAIYEDTAGSCTVGNPVNIFDGSKQDRVVDYRGSGVFPIVFERRYNSTITGFYGNNGVARGFGSWGHNYAQEIRVFHEYDDGRELVRIYHANGTYSTHTRLAGSSSYDAHAKGAVKGALEKTATGWLLVFNSGASETFDAQGKLTAKTSASGSAHSVSYNADGRIDTITSDVGDQISFQYGDEGKISAVTAAGGQVVSYTHSGDLSGELTRVDYPNGEVLEYAYAGGDGSSIYSDRLLSKITRDGVVQAEYEYDDDYRVIKEWKAGGSGERLFSYRQYETDVTNPLGRKATYRHADRGNSRKILSVAGAATENCLASASNYEYTDDGQLSAKVDWEGNRTEYERDALGRVTSKTVGTGTAVARTTTTTWHAQWSKPVQRLEPGRTTDNTYDANGNVATRTVTDTATGLIRTWTFSHSGTGQLLSVDGPRTDVSDTTTFSYYNCSTGGQCGQRHTATNALGHVTIFNDYDAHGNVLRLTDANGVQTVLTYDLRQRLLTSTVDGATTTYTYDPVGNITRVTSPDGSYLAYDWDQANRLVAIEDALANRMEWDLDAADNRTATRYKDASGTLKLNQQQVFDELSRLIKTVYAVSGEASYGYDKNGNRTSSVEPGGATTSSGYDALNRLVSSTDAAQGVTGYGYDSQDNLTTVTDATGNTTTYTYNGFGDLLKLESPDTGTTVYTVDAAGNRLSETDARGVTVSYQYDALNRLTSKSYADSSLNVSYSYDQGVNGIGRLSQVGDSTGSTAYSFDARGNITEQRSTIGGVLYSTGYSYDAANKLTGTTYPSGRSLAYGYDTAGRLSSINHTGDGSSETLISNLQYLPFGPLTGYTLGNGAVRTVEYDLDYRIGRIADGAILDRSYSYSAANNISGITDALAATNTQLFGYDDLNRLTSAAGAYGSHGYDYDAVGNRTQFSADAGNQSYSYAPSSNRLTDVGGTARSRDAAGNLTATGGNAFSYGEHNRLSGVTGLAGNVQYGHNALGQRVSKTANGTTRHYLFDRQGQLVGEANSDGSEPVEYAYLNGQPLAMWRSADGGGNGGGNTGNVLNAGEGDSGALGLKEWRHYTLSPSSNARTATVTMSGLTGDGDLYLKLGAQADDSTFDCKSDAGGTSTESCTLAVPENATLHIAMHGWAATDFSLSTSASDTGGGGGGSTTGGELGAGESASGSAGLKEWHHYTLTPAATARSVTVAMGGLTADGDLYLRLGTQNDGSTFDCRSDNGGTSQESCTVDVAANETLHIGVHGWQATDYALSTTATDTGTGGGGNTGGELAAGEGASGSLAAGEWRHHTLTPAANARTATVTMSGLTGDGDLYVRFGQQADTTGFDCKSDNGGTSTESCTLAVPANQTLHIALHGYAETAFTLSTSASDTGGGSSGGSTGGALTLGQSVTGSVGLKVWHHYTLAPSASARAIAVTMGGLSDDGDLYLRLDTQNDGTTFDCQSDNGGTSAESCALTVPANQTLHIGVHGWQATDYALTAGGQ